MAKTAYPYGADLAVFLLGHPTVTLTLLNGINLQEKCNTARGNFEGLTGRRFLAAQATRTYTWNGNRNGFLALNADIASLTSLKIGGSTLTNNTDFELWPQNADADNEPWSMVKFFNLYDSRLQARRSVEINALWGMPIFEDDAWNAILSDAAIQCVPELALNIGQGMNKRKEGDTEYTITAGNISPFSEEKKTWQRTEDAALAKYTRVAVGLG